MKHSYIINRELIFCILSEDEEFFYGEILYGAKKVGGVKYEDINKKRYYKYWQLSDRKKGGNYRIYFDRVKTLYPKYIFHHNLMGDLFKMKKSENLIILQPIRINELPKNLISFGNKIKKFLGLKKEKIYFSGSILSIKKSLSSGDIDILIKGLKSNKKISRFITSLTKKEEFSLKEKNSLNRRRFKFGGKIICPFGVYKGDNFFEKNFLKKDKEEEIYAKVIDNSLSLFSPSVYKIKIGKKFSYLISYNVGHVHFLRKGEKIKFNAPLCYFNSKKISSAYVIPIEGFWIEILSP